MEKKIQEASTKVFANKRRVINQLPNICTPNGSYVTRPSASRSVSSQCGAQPTRPSGNRLGHSLTTQGHQKHHIYHQPLSEWQWKSPLQLPDVHEGTPWQKISGCAGLEVWTQTLSEAASITLKPRSWWSMGLPSPISHLLSVPTPTLYSLTHSLNL